MKEECGGEGKERKESKKACVRDRKLGHWPLMQKSSYSPNNDVLSMSVSLSVIVLIFRERKREKKVYICLMGWKENGQLFQDERETKTKTKTKTHNQIWAVSVELILKV